MLKPSQKVIIKWCSRNKNRLVNLGYHFTKIGDEVSVNVEDLSDGSPAKIKYVCDYCGVEVETKYMTYTRSHKYIDKDACKKCAHLKSQEAFVAKHGVTNPLQVPEINQKQRDTCMERYGVEYALQNQQLLDKKNETCIEKYGETSVLLCDKIRQKKEETCLEKYGHKHSWQSDVVRQKCRQTCLEKYGVEVPSQTKEVQDKMRSTFKERYGVEYSLQVPEFAHKARVNANKTMHANGTVTTSSQQIKVYEMCVSLFGENNVTLNKPLSKLSLDIELIYNGEHIDVEYDGRHWHNDPSKDRARDEVVKAFGYRVLRIKGDHGVPTEQMIVDAVEKLVNENRSFLKIELDT